MKRHVTPINLIFGCGTSAHLFAQVTSADPARRLHQARAVIRSQLIAFYRSANYLIIRVSFQDIDATSLNVSNEAVKAAFAPFICEGTWSRGYAKWCPMVFFQADTFCNALPPERTHCFAKKGFAKKAIDHLAQPGDLVIKRQAHCGMLVINKNMWQSDNRDIIKARPPSDDLRLIRL